MAKESKSSNKAAMPILNILAIIVIILVVAAVGAYFYFGQKSSSLQNPKTPINTSTVVTSVTTTISTIVSTSIIPAISTSTTSISTPSRKSNDYIYISNIGNFSVGSGTISVINSSTNKVIATIPAGISAGQMIFIANSTYAFALTQSGVSGYHNISIINYTRNQFVKNVSLGRSSITAFEMAITPDGKSIYVIDTETCGATINGQAINQPGIVQVVNISTYSITNITVGSCPEGVLFTPNGKYAYIPNLISNSISVINIQSRSIISTIQLNQPSGVLAVTSDGKTLYSIGNSSNYNVNSILYMINATTGSVGRVATLGLISQIIGINPTNKFMYIINYGSNSISIVNTSINLIENSVSLPSGSSQMEFSPDGKTAYIFGYYSNYIFVMNTSSNKITSQIPIRGGAVAMNMTPDGKFIYVAIDNQTNSKAPGVVLAINATSEKISSTIPVGINPDYINAIEVHS
jgi:YVTN family beta-propeller protein